MLEQFELSPKDLEKISSYLKPLKMCKGDIFIKEGEKNDKIGILFEGILISTYLSHKGKEEVSRIYSRENNFTIVSNHESFYFQTNSTENIIAIEESFLMTLTKKNMEIILKKFPKFQVFARELSERSYINAIDRLKQFQSNTAKERIADYYAKYKSLFNRVNKKHLASFLGINRNDFTKLLNEIIREN